MHDKSYTIIIDKPVDEVFAASLNPENTPLWIDSIAEEQASESPAKLGTIYKNRGEAGDWTEYSITEFEHDRSFTLSEKSSAYHVRYTFEPVKGNQTEFTYREWDDGGQLESPMPEDAIHKFKQLVEAQ